MAKIKNILVTIICDDGTFVSDVIDGNQEFVSDISQNKIGIVKCINIVQMM